MLFAQEKVEENTSEEEIAAEQDITEQETAEEQTSNEEVSEAPQEKIKITEAVPESDVIVDENPTNNKKYSKHCNCTYTADTPYPLRRTRWGGYFGVQSGLYTPANYLPDFKPGQTFSAYYGDEKTPLGEITFGLKLNFFLGSLSTNFTGGYFSAKNSRDNSALVLYPLTGGLLLALDNIFDEPYVVPYGLFGAYTVFYNEKVGGLSVSGNSAMGMFYAAGLMFQLDWIDQDSDYHGYDDYGLENTFLFVEARSFLTSSNSRDPDLSTPIQIGGGLKVEF